MKLAQLNIRQLGAKITVFGDGTAKIPLIRFPNPEGWFCVWWVGKCSVLLLKIVL